MATRERTTNGGKQRTPLLQNQEEERFVIAGPSDTHVQSKRCRRTPSENNNQRPAASNARTSARRVRGEIAKQVPTRKKKIPVAPEVLAIYFAFHRESYRSYSEENRTITLWLRDMFISPGVWHVEFLFRLRPIADVPTTRLISYGVMANEIRMERRKTSYYTNNWSFMKFGDSTKERRQGIYQWCRSHVGHPLSNRAFYQNFLCICWPVDPWNDGTLANGQPANCVQPLLECLCTEAPDVLIDQIAQCTYTITPRQLYDYVTTNPYGITHWQDGTSEMQSGDSEFRLGQLSYIMAQDSTQ